jgi:hypothetical protein
LLETTFGLGQRELTSLVGDATISRSCAAADRSADWMPTMGVMIAPDPQGKK